MKRTLIYARVAASDQTESNLGLSIQVEACRQAASSAGDEEVITQVTEIGSGNKLERKGLAEVKDAIKNGSVDVVRVYSENRLARRPDLLKTLLDELDEMGVEILFARAQSPLMRSDCACPLVRRPENG